MVDLRNIETFYWIATLSSFRLAAEKLHTTQPAVSQRIALLEDDLKVCLFERNPGGITLTAKGHELLVYAQRMLTLRHDLIEAAHAQNVMTGTLRLGVTETLVQTWLLRLIEDIRRRYPALLIEIEVETTLVLRQQLLARKVDLALLLGPMQESQVETLALSDYPLAWVSSPTLKLGGLVLDLKALTAFPLITHPKDSMPYLAVRKLLAQAGMDRVPMYTCASVAMMVRMAKDGMGICVLTPSCLEPELREGELELLKVNDAPLPRLRFVAAWMTGHGDHSARMVARLAQGIAVDHEKILAHQKNECADIQKDD